MQRLVRFPSLILHVCGEYPIMTSACAGHLAEHISRLAVGAIYLLAGVPETVELCLSVAGGLVDTHVLMTLAALGLLALSQAPEASSPMHAEQSGIPA